MAERFGEGPPFEEEPLGPLPLDDDFFEEGISYPKSDLYEQVGSQKVPVREWLEGQTDYIQTSTSLAGKLRNLREGKEANNPNELLTQDELIHLARNIIDHGEKSQLAENYLNTQGFKTFEDAMRHLNLREVEVYTPDGLKWVEINENTLTYLAKSPAVAEHLKKLGISGGVSAATVGLTCLLGGPVLWQAAIGGVVGGVAGRLIGEAYRHISLTKKERGSGERFNDVMAQNLLMKICEFQMRAGELFEQDERGADRLTDDQKAQRVYDLLSESTNEAEELDRYRSIERKTNWVKAGASLLLSMGGSMIGSAIVGNTLTHATEGATNLEMSNQLRDATEHGVRIINDVHGVPHLTLDSNQGHLYKEMADGQWHAVINNHDVQQALQVAKERGQHDLTGILNAYYFSPETHSWVTGTGLTALPKGVELLNANHTLTSAVIGEALKQHSQEVLNHTVSSTALIEAGLPGILGSLTADSYTPVSEGTNYQAGKVRHINVTPEPGEAENVWSYTDKNSYDRTVAAYQNIEGQRVVGTAKHPIENGVSEILDMYKLQEKEGDGVEKTGVKIEYDKKDGNKFTIEMNSSKNAKTVLSFPDYTLTVYEKGERSGGWTTKESFRIPTPNQANLDTKDLSKWQEKADQFIKEAVDRLGGPPPPTRRRSEEASPPPTAESLPPAKAVEETSSPEPGTPRTEASPEIPKEVIADYFNRTFRRIELNEGFARLMRDTGGVFIANAVTALVVEISRQERGSERSYAYAYYLSTGTIDYFDKGLSSSDRRTYLYDNESWAAVARVMARHVEDTVKSVEESMGDDHPLIDEEEL